MRYTLLCALLAGAAMSSPMPQGFDWVAIEDPDLAPVPTPDIPVVASVASVQATTISFATALAVSSVTAAVLADPTDTSLKLIKRVDDSQCTVQPSVDDTAADFLADPDYSNAAENAQTPAGYELVFSNLHSSSQGVYGYMGYTVLNTYDTVACSESCDAVFGCQSFNIYFERDASVTPTTGCTNPPSTTLIKCVYYGGPVTSATATNSGQYQDDFQVVIAGSNGYVNNSIATPPGYNGAIALGNAAIDAPLDCAGHDTYMGVKIFTSGPFDASLCAAACSATSTYDSEYLVSADGYYQTCQFFNTFVLYNGTKSVGQYCAMYNETWPSSYATNVGQYRGSDYYTIGYSYAFSNTTGHALGLDEPSTCTNPASP